MGRYLLAREGSFHSLGPHLEGSILPSVQWLVSPKRAPSSSQGLRVSVLFCVCSNWPPCTTSVCFLSGVLSPRPSPSLSTRSAVARMLCTVHTHSVFCSPPPPPAHPGLPVMDVCSEVSKTGGVSVLADVRQVAVGWAFEERELGSRSGEGCSAAAQIPWRI